MSAPPPDHPITGMCIVSDPEKCPPGYELIYKSFDKRDDCDLWKDGFFSSKVTRYLCITRVWPLDSGRLNNVLGDVVINNERENPYPGFTVIDKTVDSGEQATKKKQFCVKMLPRNVTADAICDIIILSKNKRAPAGYTLVGEINGLSLCYKMGKVPPETQNVEPARSTLQQNSGDHWVFVENPNQTQNNVSGVVNVNHPLVVGRQNSAPLTPQPIANNVNERPTFERQKSTVSGHALHDVPFVLSSKYQGLMQLQDFTAPTFNFRTLSELENEFSYPFRLERQAASQRL